MIVVPSANAIGFASADTAEASASAAHAPNGTRCDINMDRSPKNSRACARGRAASRPRDEQPGDQTIGGLKGVSIEAAMNRGRSIGEDGSASATTNVGAASCNVATVTHMSAQSPSDFAGQQGHFG